jgi:small subunit ribosomal protein S33
MRSAIERNKTVYPSTSNDPHIFLAQKVVFGYFKGDNAKSGRKVLRRPLIGERLIEYYPDADVRIRRAMVRILKKRRKGLVDGGNLAGAKLLDARIAITRRTPTQRYQALRMSKLRRRGKGPPKKGFGKRAGKRKKK